jgi:hypothetical protein
MYSEHQLHFCVVGSCQVTSGHVRSYHGMSFRSTNISHLCKQHSQCTRTVLSVRYELHFLCIVDMKFRLRCPVSLCEICGGKIGAGTGSLFVSVFRISPSLSFFQSFQPIFTLLLFSEGQAGKTWELKKSHLVKYVCRSSSSKVEQLYHD